MLLIAVIIATNYFSSFLFFHFVSEFFAVFVALSIGLISYFTFYITKNKYLFYLGIGYTYIGLLDIMHALTFPGMNIFEIDSSNTSLTFWVLTRVCESLLLLSAIFMRNIEFSGEKISLLFMIVAISISVFSFYFPLVLFNESNGLTSLKNNLEYLCIAILIIAMVVNNINIKKFNIKVYKSIQFAIIFTILAELSFTTYLSMSGLEAMLGHVFKFISFWIIFNSLVKVSLINPIELLAKENDEKKQMLDKKHKQIQDIVHTINDFIWEVDKNGIYTYASPQIENILGYKPEEIIGKTPFDLMTKEEAKKIKIEVSKIFKNENSFNQLKNENLHKNGSVVYFETSGVPIFDSDKNLIGYRGTDRNVTKRVLSDMELKQSHLKIKEFNENLELKIKEAVEKNQEKDKLIFQQSKMASMGEMIENIAHQWRQPLSVIAAASTGVKFRYKMGVIKEDDIEKSMDGINNSVQHLSQTIDDFRNFFKTNREKKKFILSNSFEKTFQLIISQFKNANIIIIKDIKNITLLGYENELIQVLINILNNARDELIKKDQKIKLIQIDTNINNNKLEIYIKDNAGGIPEDFIDEIFESHFTTKEDSDGTGVGLYMSKMIIEEHMNGTIDVGNINFTYEGDSYRGAQFKICLPLLDES